MGAVHAPPPRQCQGHPKLIGHAVGRAAKIAAPAAERELFEKPLAFRKAEPQLSDRFTVHGASYVRPPIQPIPIDRAFDRQDSFSWRGREFWCAETAGNSPGAMSYLLRQGGAGEADAAWLAFTGDVMLAGATLHTWFDSEWDYGFCKGLYAAATAAGYLAGFAPLTMLPAHGPPIRDAAAQLAEFQRKLRRLEKVMKRGWEVYTFAGCDQDRVSRPTSVPHLWRISPHLYKVRGHESWVNFHMLTADDGHALLIDCGLFDRTHLDRVLDGARDRLGIKAIDAIIVTHMHGEVIRWRGHLLACDWMPGQTEFACCVHGEIDGRRVAFTGDNIFGSPADPAQHGHEAVVARNACTVEDGYGYAGRFLHGIAPDLILGGHSWAIDNPGPLIERYVAASDELRAALADLTSERDYRL